MPVNEIFRTLPEQIAARLQQDILGGHLKPGEPLREADLSERFGVSRGPVREAFRQLVQPRLAGAWSRTKACALRRIPATRCVRSWCN